MNESMTHRQVLEALSGLLLGMLVAILSSTVVSTALPRIIARWHPDITARPLPTIARSRLCRSSKGSSRSYPPLSRAT